MLMTLTSSVKHLKYTKIDGKYVEWAAWILDYEQYKYPNDLDMVSRLIVDNLEMKFCSPRYRDGNMGNPLFGHCVHATQAMYYFFKNANLKVMSAKCKGPAEQHWWLQDGDNIIDITASQYEALDVDPPYDKGKETKWYGWKNRPHRRSQKLMKLVQPSANLYFEQYKENPNKIQKGVAIIK
jgi:hypothetical protein